MKYLLGTIESWHLILFWLLCQCIWNEFRKLLHCELIENIIIHLDANLSRKKISASVRIEIEMKINDTLNDQFYWCENCSFSHLIYEVVKVSIEKSSVFARQVYNSHHTTSINWSKEASWNMKILATSHLLIASHSYI